MTNDHKSPPAYTRSTKRPHETPSSSHPQKTPCNYTRVVRESGPIEETFVVDHSIQIDEPLLPPLSDAQRQAEGGRSNLYVRTKSGDVDVNIHLVDDSSTSSMIEKLSLRAKLRVIVESDNGDVVVRLVLLLSYVQRHPQ